MRWIGERGKEKKKAGRSVQQCAAKNAHLPWLTNGAHLSGAPLVSLRKGVDPGGK